MISKIHKIENVICENHYKSKLCDVKTFGANLCKPYIHCFVRASTVRHDMFMNVQLEAGLVVMELPKQSDTRWVCKHKAVTVFKLRLPCVGLLKTLKHFAEQPGRNSKERAEAKGLLLQL